MDEILFHKKDDFRKEKKELHSIRNKTLILENHVYKAFNLRDKLKIVRHRIKSKGE